MQICSRTVEAIRTAVGNGGDYPQAQLLKAGFTLPGLVNAVSLAWSYRESGATDVLFNGWMNKRSFAEAWRIWNEGNIGLSNDVHGTRSLEFFAFHTRLDQTKLDYQLYQQRFVRSLKVQGVSTTLAHAFAGALSEMTDNIVQHSADRPDARFQGLAGFHILPGYFSFAVADVGRGILASLLTAPKWKHLRTHEEAVSAAVRDHATRRADHAEGDGFKELFRSMVDRNCQLRFRTGNACLSFEDAGHSRVATGRSCFDESGFQMSCSCALTGDQGEREIS